MAHMTPQRIGRRILLSCLAGSVLFMFSCNTELKSDAHGKVASEFPKIDKPAEPPSAGDLIGVYTGYTDDNLDFYRLDLRKNSTGYLAHVAGPDTSLHEFGVKVYRVTSWTTKGWALIVNVVPISPGAEPIYLKGQVRAFAFEMEVGGTQLQWNRRLQLQSEDRLKIPNEETKKKIEEIEKK